MRVLSVAIFFLVVGSLLVFLLRFFTQVGDGGGTYALKAFFEHTGGVKTGNPIRMVGKDIGEVGSVELDYEKRGIKMVLNIKDGVLIPKDSKLKVSEKGMLGEMYLYFSFGKSKEHWGREDLIEGTPPVVMSDLMSTAGDTIEGAGSELTALLGGLNELLQRPGFKDGLVNTLQKAPALLGEAEGLVQENRVALAKVLENMEVLSGELGKSSLLLNEQLLLWKEKDMFSHLEQVLSSANNTLSHGSNLIEDDLKTAAAEASTLLKTLNGSAAGLETIMEGLKPLLEGLKPGQKGTIAQLLHEGTLHHRLMELLSSGASFVKTLDEQPNALIFGKKKSKKKAESTSHQPQENRRNESKAVDWRLKPSTHHP